MAINKIRYTPNIKYTDTYDSEIESSISNQSQNGNNTNTPIEDNGDSFISDLINNYNNLNNAINSLPDDLKNPIQEVFDPIKDFINDELTDKDYTYVPEETEWIPVEDTDDNKINDNADSTNPADDIWEIDDFKPTVREDHTREEIVQKEYIKNLVDIFDYYYNDLNSIIANTWTNIFLTTTNKTSDEITMILNNILLSSRDVNSELKHLVDSATKMQVVKDYKLEYFKLMFNAGETITHLKQLKAMQELRLRYETTKEANTATKTGAMNNNILSAAKLSYNYSYDKAYENLYRYLLSSNKVLKSTMDTWIYELKSKQILVERNR